MFPDISYDSFYNEVGNPKEEYEKIYHYKNVIFWSFSRKDYQKTNWWSKTASSKISDRITIRTANTVRKIVKCNEWSKLHMNALIVYGSQYGTTKRYAEQLSEMINLPVISYEDIKELTEYDLIVHFGGLYAGGVKGLKRSSKYYGENTQLIIVTVGLADVYDKENTDNIRKSIRKQVPERILSNTNIFHLRGGIDYDKLELQA